jgi:acyl-CoA synthetase (AMP-forming)/AMP-acid ligase II
VELPAFVDPDSVAVLLMTSGTTAAPKSAVLRHLAAYIFGSVQQITHAMVVPTMLVRIVDALRVRDTHGPAGLRSISYGGEDLGRGGAGGAEALPGNGFRQRLRSDRDRVVDRPHRGQGKGSSATRWCDLDAVEDGLGAVQGRDEGLLQRSSTLASRQ